MLEGYKERQGWEGGFGDSRGGFEVDGVAPAVRALGQEGIWIGVRRVLYMIHLGIG